MQVNWDKYLEWRRRHGYADADIAIYIGQVPKAISDPVLNRDNEQTALVSFGEYVALEIPEDCLSRHTHLGETTLGHSLADYIQEMKDNC